MERRITKIYGRVSCRQPGKLTLGTNLFIPPNLRRPERVFLREGSPRTGIIFRTKSRAQDDVHRGNEPFRECLRTRLRARIKSQKLKQKHKCSPSRNTEPISNFLPDIYYQINPNSYLGFLIMACYD